MRIDRYTKTLLTLIVLLLAVIAFKPLVQPSPALAQGNLNGVQFSGIPGGGFFLFDSRTGDVWSYDINSGQLHGHSKIAQLGKPLVK
jgi:hypothetical protein